MNSIVTLTLALALLSAIAFVILIHVKKVTIDWKKIEVNDLASLFLSLLGLFLVVFSISQVSQSLRITASQNIYGSMLELDKIFLADGKAKYWDYFHRGKSLDNIAETSEDYGQLMSIADYYLDFFDSFTFQSQFLPEIAQDTETKQAWDSYINDSFVNSQVLCLRLAKVHTWYTPDFSDYAIGPCKKTWNIDILSQKATRAP